jgi:hypothetical protein
MKEYTVIFKVHAEDAAGAADAVADRLNIGGDPDVIIAGEITDMQFTGMKVTL